MSSGFSRQISRLFGIRPSRHRKSLRTRLPRRTRYRPRLEELEGYVLLSSIVTLASFNQTDGASPYAGVIEDSSGNLFGTTFQGGAFSDGTVYEVKAGSNSITTLASFNNTDGANPMGGLIMDSSGDLFGTTEGGGSSGDGTIYELKAGSGTINTLASFNYTDGASPSATLVEDHSGNLFGTAEVGGVDGYGTVFELPAGSGTITALASFNRTNGQTPYAGLIEDSSGNLFGTTEQGGASYAGTVYEVKAGSGTITDLVSFNDTTTGGIPYAGVIEDSSGNLFGTTTSGGANFGTVYEVKAGSGTITTLASFSSGNGNSSHGSLIEDSSGDLIGTTGGGGASYAGTVYVVKAGSGTITDLDSFSGTSNGGSPEASVIEDSSGNLFGTTEGGGASSYGTVFEIPAPLVPPVFTADTPPAAAVGIYYSYQFHASGTAPITFSATGLPAWAQLNSSSGVLFGTPTAPGTFNFTVTASNGILPNATTNVSLTAQYEPPVFTADTPPEAYSEAYSYTFYAIGTGTQPITYSATGLPPWAELNSSTGTFSGTPTAPGSYNFTITASNGVLPNTTVGVSLNVAGGANTTFNITPGTRTTIPDGVYTGGTTFNVGAGATVTIDAGTFTGGAIFNLGTGAVVDIIDSPTFSGTLSGSGAGNVEVGNGRLYVGSGGLTLNFAGSIFQWTGGQMDLGNGDLTNLGTLTITAAVDFYNDGILYNYGTIVQTGSGSLQLGTDGVFPSTLVNEANAFYLLEGSGGLSEISDSHSAPGQISLNNDGIIRKTTGTGSALLSVLGSITNSGTIESASGTLSLAATLGISQLVGNVLTGGTWNAVDGAQLQFPTGTTITSSEASLTVSGTGATITGVAGLASNSGSLVVTNGADFTTAGSFANGGNLTVGPGSNVTVAGSFSQTSSGTIFDQLGGNPASDLFGQVNATGTATLAGTFDVSLINGFNPSSGQTFNLMSFASATGGFVSLVGLSPFFTDSLGSTSLELEDAAIAAVDLAATSVTAPTTANVGQSIMVNWQVTDQSSQATAGSWQDSVYISPSPTITSSSTLLGTVPESMTLAGGASYSASLKQNLPATLAPGFYYILVQVDSLYQQADPNRANNMLAATTGQIDVGLPVLTLGTPLTDSFTASSEDHYYQITVPSGGSLDVALQSSASSGALALYVGQGTLPTPYSYEQAGTTANQPAQTAIVPQVLTPGTYYILARGVSGAAATASFTLTATQTPAVSVSASSPSSGGNAGDVTIEINGNNFTSATTASLTKGSSTISASSVDFINASQIFATFNLTGAAVGNYSLGVQQGAMSVHAPGTFQVVAANAASLNVALITPKYIRSGRTGEIVVTYTNDTENDIIAPLLNILSTNSAVSFSTPDNPNLYTQNAQVVAVAPNGPAGILSPGESGQLTFTLLDEDTIEGDALPVEVNQIVPGQTLDWAAEEAALRPSTIPAAAWNTVFGNLLTIIGTTTDSYNAALAQAATYVSGLGETTAEASDVDPLWSFLVTQAAASFPNTTLTSAVDASLVTPGSLSLSVERTFNSSIAARSTPGIFGLGWTTDWQVSLSLDAAGDATIDCCGHLSYFPIEANGTFLNTDAEYGSLTESAGTYTYTNSADTQYVFAASGRLNYEQDKNGNRITLGYNGQDQLVNLTYSNPSDPSAPTQQLTLTYNNQGFVSEETDGTGNVWTFAYDSAGHLISVVAPGPTAAGLTTTYAYDNGNNAETTNALLSITNPDGSQQNFSYDSLGRLASTSANGGTEKTTYTYPGEAEVVTTDSAGDQSIVWFNSQGLQARAQDPRGGVSTYIYNNNDDLVSFTNPAGATYHYTYDQNGNVTEAVNPLGQAVQMTYNSMGDMTSITDAGDNTTQYSYGSTGNLLNITYPGGTQQSFTYDPLGNLSETIEQNGDPVRYQYNSDGQVTQESFADGTYLTYGYDVHGNLVTAQSYNAGDTLTGTTTLTYNAANELTSITYPGGLSLTFVYNAQGQRTESVDQSGYTINYSYDSLGRLVKLTDGSRDLIVQYTYNTVGLLQEKLNGNGTYTTYAYDPAGNLTSEVNYASAAIVNSSFTYTFNAMNDMTSMTDADGNTTTYGYDAIGDLTEVTLPGGATITYVYNAAGDRTEVVNNGTPTSYSSNDDNEITQVGSTTYTYDANGNLAAVTDSSGTSTYTYNDLNQLISISGSDGSVTTFQYNPLGSLVGENVNGTQTNFLVDPSGVGTVVASYNGNGSLIAHYNYAIGLVSQTGPAGTGYYDFDASGNTVGITGTSGTYVNRYSYLPFGETTTIAAALPNPFQFVGNAGVMTIGSGLEFMRARFYSSAVGQFLSRDPLGPASGQPDLYAYAGQNPLKFIDPSGMCFTQTEVTALTNRTANAVDALYEAQESFLNAQDLVEYLETAVVVATAAAAGATIAAEIGALTPAAPYLLLAVVVADAAVEAAELTLGYAVDEELIVGTYLATATAYATTLKALLNTELADVCPPDSQTPPPPKPPPPTPPMPPNFPPGSGGGGSQNVTPIDPNELIGPSGYGTAGFILPNGTLPYTIEFENDGDAAAQDVTVTEQLDSSLNWSTFQLGSFGFGNVNFVIPSSLTQYQTTVSYLNSDGSSLNVLVTLAFNVQTGLLTVNYVSLDPLTGQAPAGVFDGFLYPESTSAIDSDGFVQYTVAPAPGLTTGTTINQQASVVFDTNAPLETAVVTNTIDAGPPTSTVGALPSIENSASFPVSWSGSDDSGGSGIAAYAIYDSENGGPYQLFMTASAPGSATFTGQSGDTYSFYSIAVDNVGHVQTTPSAPQATTTVQVPLTTSLSAVSGSGTYGSTATLTATLTERGTPLVGKSVTFTLTSGGKVTTVGTITAGTGGVATLTGVSLAGFSAGTFSGVITASFAGDSTDQATSASGNLTVNPANVSSQVRASESGLVYNRATQVFGGTITLTNTGSTALTGEIEILLTGLPSGVTLANATGYTADGTPYITINLAGGTLAAGQSISIAVLFSNPNKISFEYGITIFDV